MDKQLKDYLHFYLGCQIDTGTGYVTLTAVQKEVIPCTNFRVIVLNGNVTHELMWSDRCKIVLRKLESMTEEEAEDLARLVTPKFRWEDIRILEVKPTEIHFMDGSKWYGDGVEEFNDCYISLIEFAPACFHYLLSRGLDLFGLIDAGLAINKATLNS